MEALFLLIPISLTLAFFALIGFVWAVKDGQFKDLTAPAEQILFDDHESSK